MKWISRAGFAVFTVSVPFLLYGFALETWRIASSFSLSDGRWRSFTIGAATFVPCLFIARRFFHRAWSWIGTFEHELTHLLVGVAFLKLPVGFRVTAYHGGEMRYVGRGSTGVTWISLAPYFFPTVTILVIIVAWMFDAGSGYLLGALGWTTTFHLVTNWGETSFRQPDLKKAGILRTLVVLPVMNLVCYGAVLAFVAGGGKGLAAFWRAGFGNAFRVPGL